MRVKDFSYLIIGGAPKAGTTSLYRYLADHPDVCSSSIKETRFFLDSEYPLSSVSRYNGENLEAYNDYFVYCDSPEKIRMEATPDYLYSENAVKIAGLLPKSKMIFIRRDPVERMVSWYKFARQKGYLDQETDFESYVRSQAGLEIEPNTPVHMRALDQGRYEKYLLPFTRAFGDRLMVIDFEDLKRDPADVMIKVCRYAGLKEDFYADYEFLVENASYRSNFLILDKWFFSVRRFFAYRTHRYPWVRCSLRLPYHCIKKMLALSYKEPDKVMVSKETKQLIRAESARDA